MVKSNVTTTDLEREFERLAIGGFIGDPRGKPAYAYIRVSSDGQADEGRSGLPRQIQHIHEIAQREGYFVSLDMVFADDYSGLIDFEPRPELSKLRREFKSTQRRATTIIFEHLDRLARRGWHQDFLLQEMKDYGVQPVFWKAFSSRIERAVMSAISEEGMEDAKARMREGFNKKAQRGEITSRRRLYGYQFEDSYYRDKNGHQHIRRKTGYVIYEPEAIYVRQIFNLIAGGSTMSQVATKFTEENVPLPGRSTYWAVSFISEVIKNPAYKGEYIHNRRQIVDKLEKGKDDLTLQPKPKRVFTDPSEWIVVPVPAIVSPEVWEAANDQIARNRNTSKRNAKREYLLTGLLRCACCGYGYYGKRSSGKHSVYRCSSNTYGSRSAVQRPNGLTCDQPSISTTKLDNAVWESIWNLLFTGDNLIRGLEARMSSESNESIASQVKYLEKQITTAKNAVQRAQEAYERGAYDLDEYLERVALHKRNIPTFEAELARLKPQQLTPEQFEAHKQEIKALIELIRSSGNKLDLSFDFKKKIVNRFVDKIVLDTKKGEFTIEGTIGRFTVMGVVVGAIDSAFVR